VFAAFRERYPRIELRIDNRPSPVIAERVSENQVDLGIVSLPLPERLVVSGQRAGERLLCEELAPQEDVAVCSPTHLLAKRRAASVQDLSLHPLLLLDRTTSSRALVDMAFSAANVTPVVAMEMSSVEVLKRLAELGFGVAIVPRISVQREHQSGTLSVLRLEHFGAPRSVGALMPLAFSATRAARAFLELARAHSKPRRSSSSSLKE
jgi:DNA-binding transcriptional LysR family regulator